MDFNAGFCVVDCLCSHEDDKNITGFIIENDPNNGITMGEEEHKLKFALPLHGSIFNDTVDLWKICYPFVVVDLSAMNALNVGRIKLAAAL